jgi:hypothetical protein
MGYTLKIGEAVLDFEKEESYLTINAKTVKLETAPAFGEPTDHSNTRWPSYSSWDEFCQSIDIHDIMFDANFNHNNIEGCLLQDHPGHAVITQEHIEYIESRIDSYKKKNPTHIAQYRPLKPGIKKEPFNKEEDYINDPMYDGNLCRAEWLIYWLKWTVDNCEIPIFYNS